MFAGDLNAQMQEVAEEAATSGDFGSILGASMEMGKEIAKKTALPMAVGSAILSYLIAMLFNNMIKSDPGDNQYGPAT